MIKKWHELAQRCDDLKYCLINYGTQFGPVIKCVQREYKKASKALDLYEQAMEDTGLFTWDATFPCYPKLIEES